jgi:hypothetical protein
MREPLRAPIGADEYRELEAHIKALETEHRDLEAQVHRARVDSNRSKPHTPKGAEARSRYIRLCANRTEISRKIEECRIRLQIAALEQRLASAPDECSRDSLRYRLHLLQYPVVAPGYWEDWPEDVAEERKRLLATLEEWAARAKRECPADFTPEMAEAVEREVLHSLCYQHRSDDTPYTTLRNQAIQSQRRAQEAAQRQREREDREARERYAALHPMALLKGVARREWMGNVMPPGAEWVSDTNAGFARSMTTLATAQKLAAQRRRNANGQYALAEPAALEQYIVQAQETAQPVEILGWLPNGDPRYNLRVAYLVAGNDIYTANANKLRLLAAILRPDRYGLGHASKGASTWPILLLYRQDKPAGFLVCGQNAPRITLPDA